MLGWLILFGIAFVAGYRRGVIDAKSIGAIAAISLFVIIVIVVGRSAMTPLSRQPNVLGIAIAYLGYFLPMLAGYAIGATAKKQRLANDADDHGAA